MNEEIAIMLSSHKRGLSSVVRAAYPEMTKSDLEYLKDLDARTIKLPRVKRTDIKMALLDIYLPKNTDILGKPANISELHSNSIAWVGDLIEFLTQNVHMKDPSTKPFLLYLKSHLNSKPNNKKLKELQAKFERAHPNISSGMLNEVGNSLSLKEQWQILASIHALPYHLTLWHQLGRLVNNKNARNR